MLYAVIQRFDSLREIETSMTAEVRKLHHIGIDTVPRRSTLSDAKRQTPQKSSLKRSIAICMPPIRICFPRTADAMNIEEWIVDYVTRRKLEEKLYKEQSKGLKADERKYESNGSEDIIDHLSKDWKLLSSSGDIRIYEGRKAMADDIARPSRQRKPVKDPVGHISLDFHPDDAPKMTDELMAEVAQEYMRQMGLTNTPYIVVRHFDKAHPHCHIVFSRVDYDGKILTQTTNFKKNERVCKALNLKHRLTQGKSKLNTDVSKLREKIKSVTRLSTI